MMLKIFAIFDAKALAYLPPFVLPEEGMAMRTFSDCVNSKDHQFGAHPEDYTLFFLGLYDDKTGIFSELEARSVLANGVEMVRLEVPAGQQDLPVNGADLEPAYVSPAVEAKLKAMQDSIGDDHG